jgi:hypothetical protein
MTKRTNDKLEDRYDEQDIAMAKEEFDSGRIIEAAWLLYVSGAPADMSMAEVGLERQVFFTGVYNLYALMADELKHHGKITASQEWWRRIGAEMDAWFDGVSKKD